jgi:glycosyltransferase involved in cell wall biosynthesis
MSPAAAEKPRFSVVIAAYNSARWIETTLDSVLAQTYRDYEVLVVGDGCTDGTADIVRERFGDLVAWTNLAQNSGGQSFPNNEGIRRATGTHVAYLGHDDIWAPTHLARMAEVVVAQDPDFVVSGAICHGPPGSMYYHITGLFEDPSAAATDFFPPSSFAHRREVAGRIGGWRHPTLTSAPADCDFLLRAVEADCSFASTNAVTVHKFAAGHRYLSYRFPSDAEQSRMLARLAAPDGEADVLRGVRDDIAQGADNLPLRYYDFATYGAGEIYRGLRRAKGLDAPALHEVTGSTWLPVTAGPAALDWHDLETHPLLGLFRWSGPNPAPRYLVNARLRAPARLSIHVLAFAHPALMERLEVRIDERAVEFDASRDAVGGYTLKVAAPIAPSGDGVVITLAMPFAVPRAHDGRTRRVGLALRGVSLEPVTGPHTARHQT